MVLGDSSGRRELPVEQKGPIAALIRGPLHKGRGGRFHGWGVKVPWGKGG